MVKVILFAVVGLLALINVSGVPAPPATATNVNSQPAIPNNYQGGNPIQNMFRSFASYLPPYANPASYIPQQLANGYGFPYGTPGPFPGGHNQFPFAPYGFGQQFIPGQLGQAPPAFGGYTNYPPAPTSYGVGYSGPFTSTIGYGAPNPNYGNEGNVPVVTTRLNNQHQGAGQPYGYPGSNNGQVSVSVQGSPEQGPIFRSQTVRGPNSYGTAFAYTTR